MDNITVIIPTLNEAEAIGIVIDEIIKLGIPCENIVVVDGGSTDGTIEIARSKGVRVVFQEGSGKSLAIKTGLRYVRTPYVVVMDGDYTYPAIHILDLYAKILEGHDLVIGARKCERGVQHVIYRFGNWILTRIFNILFGTKITDVLSGMYIAHTDRLREILFEMPHFSVETEIVAHIASTTGRITEIPIHYRKRLGKKKLRIIHGLIIARDMIRLAWRYNPVFFIFALGTLLLIPGLLLGAWVAYHYFFMGIKYYVKGLIATFLAIAGLLSMFHAIMAIYIKRVEMRTQQKFEEILDYIRESLRKHNMDEKQ